MDYELLYIKLVKKLELNIKECDTLVSNPQVSQENKGKYIMAKVFLNGLKAQVVQDIISEITK